MLNNIYQVGQEEEWAGPARTDGEGVMDTIKILLSTVLSTTALSPSGV